MKLIAHRGLTNKDIKENTLEAFKNAIKNNYDGIELDIRKTKDNKIIVLHDKFINRTSNGKGNVNNITYKNLLKYNFGSKKIKSKIPLLSDVIKVINNKIILIELKEKIGYKELNNIIKINKNNTYYIMSFNEKNIEESLGHEYKVGIINGIYNSLIDIDKYDFILILNDLFNKNIYEYFKNKNIEVIVYNTNGFLKIKDNVNIDIKYVI